MSKIIFSYFGEADEEESGGEKRPFRHADFRTRVVG
jgi:hypothetical protein